MNHHPMTTAIKTAIDTCGKLDLDALEAVPDEVARLRGELARINSEIASVSATQSSEKGVLDALLLTPGGDHDVRRAELAKNLSEVRAELLGYQLEIAARAKKLDGLVRDLRRMEQHAIRPAQPL
jgi:hypothetical protein